MSKTYNNVYGVLGSVNLVHVTQSIPPPPSDKSEPHKSYNSTRQNSFRRRGAFTQYGYFTLIYTLLL